jgi:hypothetical protein
MALARKRKDRAKMAFFIGTSGLFTMGISEEFAAG